jgi:leucyl aminopeptidase
MIESAAGRLRPVAVLAIAVLFWLPSPARSGEHASVPELIDRVSLENLTTTIRTLQSPGGQQSRVTFTSGNDSARSTIFGAFSALEHLSSVEYDTFYIPASVPFDAVPQCNVVATLTGSTFPERILVLGAHFDCSASRMGSSIWNSQWETIRAPGADDNATGIAVLLEVARILSDPSSGFDNAYTLKFVAFASEESGPEHSGGHGGSKHFAASAKARGENIVGMFSIDMIGFNPDHHFLAIVADSRSQWLGANVLAARDELGIDLLTNSSPFPSATYSDHASFWEQSYPAILLIENAPPWENSTYYTANPYYHTSRDTLETLNMELVRAVAQVTLASAIRLSGTVTAVETPEIHAGVPAAALLLENYPNPFNPETTIRFRLPRQDVLRLTVMNSLGQELAILAEGEFRAGEHSVVFAPAPDLSSGVYFVRLVIPSASLTQRLLLLR